MSWWQPVTVPKGDFRVEVVEHKDTITHDLAKRIAELEDELAKHVEHWREVRANDGAMNVTDRKFIEYALKISDAMVESGKKVLEKKKC